MDDLLSLLAISKRLHIPESTLRYYMRRYSEYIPVIGEGRKKRYRPEAIEVLRIIANMLQKGKTANDITNQLRQRFPINIEPIKQVANEPVTNSLTNIQPENQVAVDALRKVANAIEILAGYKQELDETKAELTETKERLQRVEKELEQLKKPFWRRLFLK